MTEKMSHILVVDDELSMRELLEYMLNREGYQVTCAGDGRKAIKLLEKMKLIPSLDIKMMEDLKAGIPDIENFIEVSSENPSGGGVSMGAVRRLNEENMNHNLAMLYEKVDKHLGNESGCSPTL